VLIPNSLLIVLSMLGTIAFCCAILWSLPQLWYRIKYGKFKPSYEELELQHTKEIQELHNAHVAKDLKFERERNESLSTELKNTIKKLVDKI